MNESRNIHHKFPIKNLLAFLTRTEAVRSGYGYTGYLPSVQFINDYVRVNT